VISITNNAPRSAWDFCSILSLCAKLDRNLLTAFKVTVKKCGLLLCGHDLYFSVLGTGIREEFRVEPEDTDVVVGETATLQCRAPRGEPEPRVRWLKDGSRLRPTDRATVDPQGSLTVRDAGRQDAGSYVCAASNVAGERQTSPVQLHIRGTPGRQEESRGFIQTPLGV